MLENVNAINVNAENVLKALIYAFGDGGAVSTCDNGVIKLQVNELANGDILTISNMLQWAEIRVKRSNTKILALFIPKMDSGTYSDEFIATMDAIKADSFDSNDEFKDAATPLMNYLSENHHPHVYATVDSESAMLIEGLKTVKR